MKTLRRGHPVMIPRVPTIFGHEFAGTVTAVGAGVGGRAAGGPGRGRELGALRRVPGLPAGPGEPLRRPPLRQRRLRRVHRAASSPGGAQPGDGATGPTRRASPSPSPWPAVSAPSMRRPSGRGTRWPSWATAPSASSSASWPARAGRGWCSSARRGRAWIAPPELGFAACVDVARVPDAGLGRARRGRRRRALRHRGDRAAGGVGAGDGRRRARGARSSSSVAARRARASPWTRAASTTRSCGSWGSSTTPRG